MHVINTPLPDLGMPMSWAVERDGILYTAQIPIRQDGSIETGYFADQARLTMDNLAATLKAAGGSMADLTQVMLYLTEASDAGVMNDIYADYVEAPFPNRATVIVKALAVPGMKVEIVAHAHLTRD